MLHSLAHDIKLSGRRSSENGATLKLPRPSLAYDVLLIIGIA